MITHFYEALFCEISTTEMALKKKSLKFYGNYFKQACTNRGRCQSDKREYSDLMWLPLPFCGFQEWGRGLYTVEMALWWFIKGSEP